MSDGFRKRQGRWGPRISVIGATIVLVFGLSAQQALAVTHTESPDAPALVPGQTPGGSGALTSISGSTSPADQEDLYRICVTSNSFSATTVGGAGFDTQLFLFADDGIGVARGTVANDNTTASLQSTLPPAPNTGTPSYLPGVYYLGISGFDHDPRDSSGQLIFPSVPFTGVFGPVPGRGPLASWAGATGSRGAYTITLTGAATFSSAPCGGQGAVCAGPSPPLPATKWNLLLAHG